LAVALFAGFVASLKFPLALACGRHLIDRRFGLLWAACLALPGWSSFEQLIFFNPNATAACVLLALWLCLRARERGPGPWSALALGVAIAACVHMHPTSAPVALLAIPFLRATAERGRRWRHAALVALGFALPFTPYLVSQLLGSMADLAGAEGYLRDQVRLSNLLAAPVVAWAFGRGPQVIGSIVWPGVSVAGAILAVALALPLAGLALLKGAAVGERRVLAMGLGASAILLAWIALLRPTTPVYFVFALAPAWAGSQALGALALVRRTRPAVATAVVGVAAFGLQVCTVALIASNVRNGEGKVPSQVLDIRERVPLHWYQQTWFPAYARGALGRFACADPGMVMHGHLAFVWDRSVGVDALMSCGSPLDVRLIGRDPDRTHWVGVSTDFWRRLPGAGGCRIGSLVLVPAVASPWPSRALAVPDGRNYPPRERTTSAPVARMVEFDLEPGVAIMVTNVLHHYEALADVTAFVDGVPVTPVAANEISWLYSPLPRRARWKISLRATDGELVDVAAFRPDAPAHPQCATARR
jgi:hypothetical protein